ncbi:hypothetical protein XENOCAPTIV_016311 [Xenoophorus captivus]|uniref:VWFD domain-containing protein n=1 Tax=Xenoophorus captivus TaxID=1517983 RepID=A0ABV0QDG1_9TELE
MRERLSDIIEVRLDGRNDGLEVLRNQQTLSFAEQTWMDLQGVFVFSPTSTNVTIMFPSGAGVEVRHRGETMTTTVLLPEEFKDSTLGLLGKMNGDAKDDLALSNGQLVQNHSNPEELFNFGASWSFYLLLTDPIKSRQNGPGNGVEPSRIFAQDFGLPPFLEPSDLDWLDWAKKRLASFSWPGYTQSPLLPPFTGRHHSEQDQKKLRHLTSGVSEIQTGQNSWKISLDEGLARSSRGASRGKDAFNAGCVLLSGRFGTDSSSSGNNERGGPGKHPAPLSPPFPPPLQDHACVRDEAVHRDARPEQRPTSNQSRSLDCQICEHITTIKSAPLVRCAPELRRLHENSCARTQMYSCVLSCTSVVMATSSS